MSTLPRRQAAQFRCCCGRSKPSSIYRPAKSLKASRGEGRDGQNQRVGEVDPDGVVASLREMLAFFAWLGGQWVLADLYPRTAGKAMSVRRTSDAEPQVRGDWTMRGER